VSPQLDSEVDEEHARGEKDMEYNVEQPPFIPRRDPRLSTAGRLSTVSVSSLGRRASVPELLPFPTGRGEASDDGETVIYVGGGGSEGDICFGSNSWCHAAGRPGPARCD